VTDNNSQIASRRVYTGKVINLDIDTVQYPDGSRGELEIFRHPGSSAVVPFVSDPAGDDPQLILLKQYRYAADQVLYEIPAGRLQPGESPEECARRELREETGCDAEHLEHLLSFYTTPGFTDERIHVFMAWGLTQRAMAHESDEFIEVVVEQLSNALELVRSGEVPDAKTALSLLYVAGFRLGI
jgi:ADP-ribose pyrophosphatase